MRKQLATIHQRGTTQHHRPPFPHGHIDFLPLLPPNGGHRRGSTGDPDAETVPERPHAFGYPCACQRSAPPTPPPVGRGEVVPPQARRTLTEPGIGPRRWSLTADRPS